MPVGCLALLHAYVDVGGVGEVVLIEGVMFRCGSKEPGALGGFDEHAAAGSDLLVVFAVEVVVRLSVLLVYFRKVNGDRLTLQSHEFSR